MLRCTQLSRGVHVYYRRFGILAKEIPEAVAETCSLGPVGLAYGVVSRVRLHGLSFGSVREMAVCTHSL